jgi:hypothetical protein
MTDSTLNRAAARSLGHRRRDRDHGRAGMEPCAWLTTTWTWRHGYDWFRMIPAGIGIMLLATEPWRAIEFARVLDVGGDDGKPSARP